MKISTLLLAPAVVVLSGCALKPTATEEPATQPRSDSAASCVPRYPAEASRYGMQGIAVTRVMVEASGAVSKVELSRTSGFPSLDQAALEAAKCQRYVPGTIGGVASTMWTEFPVNFTLRNGSGDPGQQSLSQGKSDEDKMAELRRLSSEIERRLGSDVRYVTAATSEPSLKNYVASYKLAVEKFGTNNFAKRNGVPVHGSVQATLTVDSAGRVVSVAAAQGADVFLARYSEELLSKFAGPPFPGDFPTGVRRVVFSSRFDYLDGK